MTSLSESVNSTLRPKWQRWAILALVLTLAAGGVALWLRISNQNVAKELAAKARLAELGALVVMDSERKHVRSVNLTTLKSPESLDQAIHQLPALTYLNSLNAEQTAFRDKHALIVGRLSSLQDLVLSHTAVTDLALENLGGLSQLKTIHLVDTAVTDAGMQSLGGLRALTIVDLSGTRVAGNFAPLRNLTNLNWLVARRLSIDAAAIRAVGECQNLNRLTLIEATCPAEALNELAQKKPNLTIEQ